MSCLWGIRGPRFQDTQTSCSPAALFPASQRESRISKAETVSGTRRFTPASCPAARVSRGRPHCPGPAGHLCPLRVLGAPPVALPGRPSSWLSPPPLCTPAAPLAPRVAPLLPRDPCRPRMLELATAHVAPSSDCPEPPLPGSAWTSHRSHKAPGHPGPVTSLAPPATQETHPAGLREESTPRPSEQSPFEPAGLAVAS